MSRGLALLSTLLTAAMVLLPTASARTLRQASAAGTISALTTASISVQTVRGTLSCAVGPKSPSEASFAPGQRVSITCDRAQAHWVLTGLRHLGTATTSANDAATTRFGGLVTVLSDTSITLHDGDRDLTCAIDSTSPPTGTLAVGAHINVACAGGTLVSWAPVSTNPGGRAYEGTIASIGTDAVAVATANGLATCTVSSGSPSLAGFSVGDPVLMGCAVSSGQLVLLRHRAAATTTPTTTPTTTTPTPSTNPATTPPPPPSTASVDQTTKGTITALTDGSITIHNSEHGDLTCTVGPHSPNLAGLNLGDTAGMGCLGGVLVIVAHALGA